MPSVTVEVWSSLRQHFDADGSPPKAQRLSLEVDIEPHATLLALLENLARKYPRFRQVMFKPGTIQPTEQVEVVLNDQLPELLDGYQTKLRDRDRILLVQAYAGG